MAIKRKKYFGSCHCKKILFHFIAPTEVKIIECNCSICKPLRFLHLIIPHNDFKLISGKKYMNNYQFMTKKAIHFFCRHCGIKSFYQPRSHKKAYSINYNSIEDPPKIKKIINFDGNNFEKNLNSISFI